MFRAYWEYVKKNKTKIIPFIRRRGVFLFLLIISIIGCYFNVQVVKEIYPYSVSVGDAAYGNPVLFIIASVAGGLFIVALCTRIHSKFLLDIGKNSFIIYALHMFVKQFFVLNLKMSLLNDLYQVVTENEILVVLCNILLTMIITILSIALGKYIKKIGFM